MTRIIILLAMLLNCNFLSADEIGWVTNISFKGDTTWVLTNEGIYKMWLHNNQIEYDKIIINQDEEENVTYARDILVDTDSNIWLASKQGVFFRENGTDKWEKIREKPAWQLVQDNGSIYCSDINVNDYEYYKLIGDSFSHIATYTSPKDYEKHSARSFTIHDGDIIIGSNYRLPFIYLYGSWARVHNNEECWGFIESSKELIIRGSGKLVFKGENISYPKYHTGNLFANSQDDIFYFDKEYIYKLVDNKWQVVLNPEESNCVFGYNNNAFWLGGFMNVKVYQNDEKYEISNFGTKSSGCHGEDFEDNLIDTPHGRFHIDELKTGIIQDKDGYTNVRLAASGDSDVLFKIMKDELFRYLEDANSNWWFVYKDDTHHGYMHRSRIKDKN